MPELAGRGMCAEWASDSTHVAAAFAPHVQQPGTVQLLIIRMAVRAHRWEQPSQHVTLADVGVRMISRLHKAYARRHYAMEQLTEANPSGFLELRWAPCLSAGGRPRLAVISRAQSSQVGTCSCCCCCCCYCYCRHCCCGFTNFQVSPCSCCIARQVRRVCPRFAHLKSSGVEVVHLRAEGSVLNSTMWSPDGETVLSVMCSTSPDPTNGSLLLTSVATGHQRIVVLPKAPVLPHCICWTPDSRLLISVTGAHACFVDKQTCATRLQRLSLPQRLCVHRAMCSRAGLVVVAHFGAQYGVFSVFSLVGAPKRLQELRQISTGRMAASLALSPSGLLLTWVDFGSRLQPAPLEGLLVQAMPCVHVCELATGRAAMLCKKPKVELTWLPIPTNAVSYAYGQDAYAGLGLFWASSGTELCISGPYNGISPTMPVQRMCLLP